MDIFAIYSRALKGGQPLILSKRVLKGTIVFTLFIAAFFLFQAYAGANTAVKAVKPAEVCMVNDTFMDKPQIPVKFEGTAVARDALRGSKATRPYVTQKTLRQAVKLISRRLS